MAKTKKVPAEYSILGIPLVEVPRRKFLCGKTPVTRAQWARVMGTTMPAETDADLPVDEASAADCWRFIEKLNASPETAKMGVTFAIAAVDDWKFACLGSKKVVASVYECGWFAKNSDGKLHPVAQKLANGYGLYDFAGSVAELCVDGKGHGGDYWTDPSHYGAGVNGVALWADCRSFGLRVFGYRNLEGAWWGPIGRNLWVKILTEMPSVADKCDCWRFFDNRELVELLVAQPSLAEYCTWQGLEGYDWCCLLEAQPQFADKCPWHLLNADYWSRLLQKQPQFADKCDKWSEMDDIDWRNLLAKQPQFASKKMKT